MPKVRPSRDKHSLALSAFGIVLSRNFQPSEIDGLRAAADTLKADLPMTSDVNSAQVDVQQPTQQVNVKVEKAGFVLQRMTPKGTIATKLEVATNRLVVQCFEYSRWNSEWPQAKKYLTTVMGAAATLAPDVRVQQLVLGVLDKFEYIDHPVPASYSQNDLFRPGSLHLTPRSASVGPMWHVHTGWFDESTEIPRARILNVLNVASKNESEGMLSGEPVTKLVTTIDHNCYFMFEEPVSWQQIATERKTLDAIFSTLHQKNKTLLGELLRDEVLKDIGLK